MLSGEIVWGSWATVVNVLARDRDPPAGLARYCSICHRRYCFTPVPTVFLNCI
jgi:hypothetical protein